MKRLLCWLLLSLILGGCGVHGERIKDPVVFYYVNESYQRSMDSVMGSEIREASGHRNDLSYLLALYTLGPSGEALRSPLPKGTKITPVEHSGSGILLELSESAQKLTDAEFTLAAACLTRTCREITGQETVTVTCGDRSVTLNEHNLLLQDPVQKQGEDEK